MWTWILCFHIKWDSHFNIIVHCKSFYGNVTFYLVIEPFSFDPQMHSKNLRPHTIISLIQFNMNNLYHNITINILIVTKVLSSLSCVLTSQARSQKTVNFTFYFSLWFAFVFIFLGLYMILKVLGNPCTWVVFPFVFQILVLWLVKWCEPYCQVSVVFSLFSVSIF